MDANLVLEGFKFMLLGMGTVFVFLITMIIMMNVMSTLIHKFFPEPMPSVLGEETKSNNKNDKKIIAAISAAIAHHKQG